MPSPPLTCDPFLPYSATSPSPGRRRRAAAAFFLDGRCCRRADAAPGAGLVARERQEAARPGRPLPQHAAERAAAVVPYPEPPAPLTLWQRLPASPPASWLALSLYTILVLPIWYGVWHTKGKGRSRGGRILLLGRGHKLIKFEFGAQTY